MCLILRRQNMNCRAKKLIGWKRPNGKEKGAPMTEHFGWMSDVGGDRTEDRHA
jgi:hypothetical protein